MTAHPIGMKTLLENSGFELIPMKATFDRARDLPEGTRVTVTASPAKGMGATVDLAEQLVGIGLDVVPHLSARLTKSHRELEEIVARLEAIEIREVFVVGGDADDPGDFRDAMDLIRALDGLGMPFERLGVTGYPEGHPIIGDELLEKALLDKLPHASYIATQMCFDTEAIATWIRSIRGLGVDLPVVIGIPGVTDVAKLMAISMRIGVGTSLRFLSKNRTLASKLIRPYAPTELVESLAALAEDPDLGVAGLHIYTFNQVDSTHEWFEEALAELT